MAAKATSSDLAEKRPYEVMVQDLQGMATLDRPEAFEIASNVIDNIVNAENLDDMFSAVESSLLSLKDATFLWNVPVNVFDVKYNKSDSKYEGNGLGVFVIVQLVTDNGESHTISTGAPNVVAFLRAAQLKGYCNMDNPLRLRFTARDTQNGVLLSVARP